MTAPAVLDGLEAEANAFQKDIGTCVRQVSIEWFQRAVLPPLPQALTTHKILQQLRTTGTISVATGRWKYWTRNSTCTGESQVEFRGKFQTLAADALQAGRALVPVDVAQRVAFVSHPRINADSSERDSVPYPDSYALSLDDDWRDGQRTVFWDRIMAAGALNQGSTYGDVNDVRIKCTRPLIWY